MILKDFLSTIPAVCSCLIGAIAGLYLKAMLPMREKVVRLFVLGMYFILIGYVMSFFISNQQKPCGHRVFVIFTSGFALVCLSLSVFAFDYKQWRYLTSPFVIFGRNAIALYLFSAILGRLVLMFHVGGLRFRDWFFNDFFSPLFNDKPGSLIYSFLFLWLCYLMMRYLHRRHIYFSV